MNFNCENYFDISVVWDELNFEIWRIDRNSCRQKKKKNKEVNEKEKKLSFWEIITESKKLIMYILM